MSKFFLNLLVQISKAFVYSKIQILFRNNFSSDSGPSGPAPSSPGRFTRRSSCARSVHSAHSARAALAYLPKGASSSSLRSPSMTFPLSHRCQVGPSHQIHHLPRVGQPQASLHRASPQLIAPRLPASIIETPIKAHYSPALILPLESPLTPPRSSMASAVNHRPLPIGISTPSSPGPL
jgi:hypothetical protein